MKRQITILMIALFISLSILSCANPDRSIYGTWKLDSKKSTDLVTWRYRQLELTIQQNGDYISIIEDWKSKRAGDSVDSIRFVPGADTTSMVVHSPIWHENWYMGVLSKEGSVKKVSGYWKTPNLELVSETEKTVDVSQGQTVVKTNREYSINRKGDVLTVKETRSTRPTPVILIFDKAVPTESK